MEAATGVTASPMPLFLTAGPFLIVLLAAIVILSIYMIPSIVAVKRKHYDKTAIIVLNIFLGWSLVGWIVALVWACTNLQYKITQEVKKMFCVNCGKELTEGANNCPHCGHAANGHIVSAPIVQATLTRYMPKDVKGWTGFLKVMSILKLIMYIIAFTAGGTGICELFEDAFRMYDCEWMIAVGFFLGLILGLCNIVKDMIYANIAENIASLGKNSANK